MKTTDEQFHHLYDTLDKARKNSNAVKVEREALANLLIDHTELQARAGGKTA